MVSEAQTQLEVLEYDRLTLRRLVLVSSFRSKNSDLIIENGPLRSH